MTSLRCHAIASPSLSKSVARYILSALAASFWSSVTTFSLPGRTSYCAFQPLLGSMPMRLMRLPSSRFFLKASFFLSDMPLVSCARVGAFFLPLVFPPPPFGRSRTCPTLDLTMKSLPRYLLMVFALAGDSTMTSDLPILLNSLY